MTLAEAGRLVDKAGGKVELEGGRLVASLPPGATSGVGSAVVPARLLYLAESAVVECLRSKQPLPEQEVTPGGAHSAAYSTAFRR